TGPFPRQSTMRPRSPGFRSFSVNTIGCSGSGRGRIDSPNPGSIYQTPRNCQEFPFTGTARIAFRRPFATEPFRPLVLVDSPVRGRAPDATVRRSAPRERADFPDGPSHAGRRTTAFDLQPSTQRLRNRRTG